MKLAESRAPRLRSFSISLHFIEATCYEMVSARVRLLAVSIAIRSYPLACWTSAKINDNASLTEISPASSISVQLGFVIIICVCLARRWERRCPYNSKNIPDCGIQHFVQVRVQLLSASNIRKTFCANCPFRPILNDKSASYWYALEALNTSERNFFPAFCIWHVAQEKFN